MKILVINMSLVVSSLGKCRVFYFMILLVLVDDVFIDVVLVVKVDDICFVIMVCGK